MKSIFVPLINEPLIYTTLYLLAIIWKIDCDLHLHVVTIVTNGYYRVAVEEKKDLFTAFVVSNFTEILLRIRVFLVLQLIRLARELGRGRSLKIVVEMKWTSGTALLACISARSQKQLHNTRRIYFSPCHESHRTRGRRDEFLRKPHISRGVPFVLRAPST